jgi:hypothetical protein
MCYDFFYGPFMYIFSVSHKINFVSDMIME